MVNIKEQNRIRSGTVFISNKHDTINRIIQEILKCDKE